VFLPVGILQGLMAPLAGIISYRGNPKIPALIGIILLAISLFMNYFLSVFSENAQIMASLYVRGIAMGLLFTPLSTLALSEIPQHKLGQASGLFNVIRQVGGSFGVALFGALLSRRTMYHSTIYGQAIDQYSPAFAATAGRLQMFSQHVLGGTTAESSARAKAVIVSHMYTQSFVSAVGDSFFLASVVSLLCAIPIIFLHWRRHAHRAQAAPLE
jgi:MFS transporter, DHA2 family, multidrug resistance protein